MWVILWVSAVEECPLRLKQGSSVELYVHRVVSLKV